MSGGKLTGLDTATVLRIVLRVLSILLIAQFTFFNVRRWKKTPAVIQVEE